MKKLTVLLTLILLVTFTLPSSAQEKREIKTEQRKYYVDKQGKKKYISTSKTQTLWNEILDKCPQCLEQAKKYNVNIWQNDEYEPAKKKQKDQD